MKALQTLLIVLLLSLFSAAQTKVSGTVKCGKPDQIQKIDVGDKPGHAFVISQGKCTWTKPVDVAGAQTKDDLGTDFADTDGNNAEVHGYVVGTLTSGDKLYVRTQGKDTSKDEKLQDSQGTWSFTGGTGKAEGIKGGGTFTGKLDADGNVIIDVKGQYTLPKKK